MSMVAFDLRRMSSAEALALQRRADRIYALTALSEGALSMGELGRRLQINGASTSYLANVLVKEGLVDRRVVATDRRSRLLVITAEGRNMLARVDAAHPAAAPSRKVNDVLKDPERRAVAAIAICDLHHLLANLASAIGMVRIERLRESIPLGEAEFADLRDVVEEVRAFRPRVFRNADQMVRVQKAVTELIVANGMSSAISWSPLNLETCADLISQDVRAWLANRPTAPVDPDARPPKRRGGPRRLSNLVS